MPRESPSSDPAWWIGAILPLPIAALFLYVASEWLFFVTKPSSLSVAPLRERLDALFATSGGFVDEMLVVQLAATALVLCVPRLRVVAVLAAGIILTLLGLMVADNFTYVVFGFSSIRSAPFARYVYGPLMFVAAAVCTRSLAKALTRYREAARRAALIWIWCLALPPIVAAVVGYYAQSKAEKLATIRPPVHPALLAASQRESAGPRRPNILFLASDGMEAKRMSVYGYEYPTTPFLESIRDETLFCENAFSNVGASFGSNVTMLTGKLPMTTKVFYPPATLPDDVARQHLPGILRERGYRAIQLSVRHYADAIDANLVGSFDLANYRWEQVLGSRVLDDSQGTVVDRFRYDMIERLETRLLHILGGREAPDAFRAVTTKETVNPFWGDGRRVRTLLEFIEATPQPWFAHVHLNDTHDGGRPIAGVARVGVDDYDETIRAADGWFRTIYEVLKTKGHLERTVVVISSDHGRGWTTLERVPLMIRFPGATHARRENRNVQLADVAPTILDSLGSPPPSWMDGVSLLRQEGLRNDRLIFGIGSLKIERRKGLHFLTDMGPPNYGARSATVISGGQWLYLDLDTSKTSVGDVDGHTAAEAAARTSEDARRLLVKKLTDSGFRLGSAASIAHSTESAAPARATTP